MADHQVTIFFHGHDHFFAKQQQDSVIYQLVPSPATPILNILPRPNPTATLQVTSSPIQATSASPSLPIS